MQIFATKQQVSPPFCSLVLSVWPFLFLRSGSYCAQTSGLLGCILKFLFCHHSNQVSWLANHQSLSILSSPCYSAGTVNLLTLFWGRHMSLWTTLVIIVSSLSKWATTHLWLPSMPSQTSGFSGRNISLISSFEGRYIYTHACTMAGHACHV